MTVKYKFKAIFIQDNFLLNTNADYEHKMYFIVNVVLLKCLLLLINILTDYMESIFTNLYVEIV